MMMMTGQRWRGYCPVIMMMMIILMMIERMVAVRRHIVVDDVAVAGYRLGSDEAVVVNAV